jgi:hypothetical protein
VPLPVPLLAAEGRASDTFSASSAVPAVPAVPAAAVPSRLGFGFAVLSAFVRGSLPLPAPALAFLLAAALLSAALARASLASSSALDLVALASDLSFCFLLVACSLLSLVFLDFLLPSPAVPVDVLVGAPSLASPFSVFFLREENSSSPVPENAEPEEQL